MKHVFHSVLLFAVVIFACLIGCGGEVIVPNATNTDLGDASPPNNVADEIETDEPKDLETPEEKVIGKVTIGPGKPQKFSIESKPPLSVGFRIVDMPQEQREKYFEGGLKSLVKLSQVDGTEMQAMWGGSVPFEPQNGKIDVEVSSLVDDTFTVEVYSIAD